MATATLIKHLNNFTGDARLYRLTGYGDDDRGTAEFVIVSAANVMFSGPETYIFPANDEGEVTDWREQEGSFRGGLDHTAALRGAGYEVTA